MSPLFLVLIIVLSVGVITYSIFLLRRSEDDPLLTRIDEFAGREEVASIEEIELSMFFYRDFVICSSCLFFRSLCARELGMVGCGE